MEPLTLTNENSHNKHSNNDKMIIATKPQGTVRNRATEHWTASITMTTASLVRANATPRTRLGSSISKATIKMSSD